MKSIGVRELRQRASEYLRHVEAGRTMEITARGRPVALLVPLRGTGHVERLVRRGRVIPPTGDCSTSVPRWRPWPASLARVPSSRVHDPESGRPVVYLDSSALVKLVIAEAESSALRRYLADEPERASCAPARVEVLRAVRDHGSAALTRARRLLQRLNLVQIDEELLDAAATLDPRVLRSLDAIHLAAAQLFGGELTAIVTYDRRMATAAGLVDLAVAAPR